MVTGRISCARGVLADLASVNDVRAISSRRHCRPATVLVTRIRVVAPFFGHRRRADEGLAGAPHGNTTTPEPP